MSKDFRGAKTLIKLLTGAMCNACIRGISRFIMTALRSRCGHYIFTLWLLSSIFYLFLSSPNLSRRRLDVCHTSTHGVALVRNLGCRSET